MIKIETNSSKVNMPSFSQIKDYKSYSFSINIKQPLMPSQICVVKAINQDSPTVVCKPEFSELIGDLANVT
jgi:hypothetical protein